MKPLKESEMLREATNITKIIAMTASDMAGGREKCLRVGMDEYISKPIDFDIMFKMIEETTVHETIPRKSEYIYKCMESFMTQTGLDKNDTNKIFEVYVKSLHEMMKNIEEALVNNDFKELCKISHQLKGTSGTLKIKDIFELARTLETSALAKDQKRLRTNIFKNERLFSAK